MGQITEMSQRKKTSLSSHGLVKNLRFSSFSVWQHPFVNIFKQFRVNDWKKSTKEGDVTSVMDKLLKCTVYKIIGSVLQLVR